jgi:ABC-2 type transport system ATP-binding protein
VPALVELPVARGVEHGNHLHVPGGAMLEALHLWKFYGGTAAVRDVSFAVGAGEIVGYLGANGSGKSTTARMVTGLLTPSRGVVSFKGNDIAGDLVAYRQRLGYVPEEPALYGYLSGREYLEFVAQLRGLPDTVVTDKVPALLRLFGIADAAELDISGYSKGMKQKVLLIAALLHDPDVLVLDEPESGLDVTAALVMRHLVTALARQGKAILYSSHVLDSVERLCTRVIVLHQGACVATGTSQELRTLMSQPTLEDVFAQLVLRQDPESTARDIADVVMGRC